MKEMVFPVEWVDKISHLIKIMVFFLIITSVLETDAMSWNTRTDGTQEEINRYAAVVADYVKDKIRMETRRISFEVHYRS